MRISTLCIAGYGFVGSLVTAIPQGTGTQGTQGGTQGTQATEVIQETLGGTPGPLSTVGAGPLNSQIPPLPQYTQISGSPVATGGNIATPMVAGASGASPVSSIDPRSATGTPGVIPPGNPPEPHNPYPNTGNLTQPEPAPYVPAGGINTNGTPPVYQALSDFDWQSINLALNQEWIELDLFQEGLRRFSVADFEAAGLNADDRFLIEFMAEQEIGHATLLSNILGPHAAKMCTYQYPFTTVREFIDFCQKLTRWGESGVYGFIEHLDSRAAAQMLLQSITTEARQQMIFRQVYSHTVIKVYLPLH